MGYKIGMIRAEDLSPRELAALLSFYADSGVEWMLDDAALDRRVLQEPAQEAQTTPSARSGHEAAGNRAASRPQPQDRPQSQASPRPAASAEAQMAAVAAAGLAVPDENAVNDARFAAESARSLGELREALLAFNGCNLKASARHAIFATGDAASGIMVIGPAPSGDDDREGQPFCGRNGMLLERMLAAIGLKREGVVLTHVLPWRPPGDRAPSQREAAICRPFIERQIELAEPKAVLLLGNFTARFFFNANESINGLRGQWRKVAAGQFQADALASLHPQDLIAAPATKSLAWQDLLAFKRRILGEM